MANPRADVVIVGGGISGTAAADGLARVLQIRGAIACADEPGDAPGEGA